MTGRVADLLLAADWMSRHAYSPSPGRLAGDAARRDEPPNDLEPGQAGPAQLGRIGQGAGR